MILVADAARRLPLPTETKYVWGGGESPPMTARRKYVRHAVGLPPHSVERVAYWRHAGAPAAD
jgi:NADPH-dependent ferric siderophore reductase